MSTTSLIITFETRWSWSLRVPLTRWIWCRWQRVNRKKDCNLCFFWCLSCAFGLRSRRTSSGASWNCRKAPRRHSWISYRSGRVSRQSKNKMILNWITINWNWRESNFTFKIWNIKIIVSGPLLKNMPKELIKVRKWWHDYKLKMNNYSSIWVKEASSWGWDNKTSSTNTRNTMRTSLNNWRRNW